MVPDTIFHKSDAGNYSYAGTGYANPHAVTLVGSTAFAYDNNGNMTSRGTNTYAWDYRNQLKQSVVNNATSTYAYDQDGSRIKQTENGVTTYYPNDYFSKTVSTTTSHIYANGELIATVQGNGTNSALYYVHTDHLGSTNVMSDTGGNLYAVYDYTPYGSMRINSPTGPYTELHRYAGSDYDISSQLNYMDARYEDRARGRFISQDPMFWSTNQDLANPQSLNSYSYAENNPIIKKDPTGNQALPYLIGIYGIVSYYALLQEASLMKNSTPDKQYTPAQSRSLLSKAALSFIPGLGRSAGIIKSEQSEAMAELGLDTGIGILNFLPTVGPINSDQIYQTTPSVLLNQKSIQANQYNSNLSHLNSSLINLPINTTQQKSIQSLGEAFNLSSFNRVQMSAISEVQSSFGTKNQNP